MRVVVLAALLGDEARAVPRERHAESEDALGEQRRLRLVLPQVALAESRENDEGAESHAERHEGADADPPGHHAFRSKTATHTGDVGVYVAASGPHTYRVPPSVMSASPTRWKPS